jgi:hypothetical protein
MKEILARDKESAFPAGYTITPLRILDKIL